MFHFIFVFLTLSWSFCAQAKIEVCSQFIHNDFRPRWLFRGHDQFYSLEAGIDDYTISIESVPPHLAQNDDFVFLVRRKEGKAWNSLHGPSHAAFQSDPRLTMIALGYEVAAVLGFRMQDDKTILIPSVSRINSGIIKLNKYLPSGDQISYRLYEQRGDIEYDYLENLVKYEGEQKIPINVDDPYFTIHDLVHLSTLGVSVNVRQRVKIINQTANDILKKGKSFNLDNKSQQKLQGKIHTFVDGIMALPLFYYLLDEGFKGNQAHDFGSLVMKTLSGGDLEPKSEFTNYIFSVFDQVDGAKVWLTKKLVDARYKLSIAPGIGMNFNQYHRMQMERRAQLRKAALAVIANHL